MHHLAVLDRVELADEVVDPDLLADFLLEETDAGGVDQ